MSSHVSYEKRLKLPSGDKLLFSVQNLDIISEVISLKYKIKLLDLAPKPIRLIRLTVEMLNPQIYEIQNEGEKMEIEYSNKSNDFVSQTISFKVKVVNPDNTLDKTVDLEVYVMDVDEGIKFPTSNYRFYSWIPSRDIRTNSSAINLFNS